MSQKWTKKQKQYIVKYLKHNFHCATPHLRLAVVIEVCSHIMNTFTLNVQNISFYIEK